MATDADDYSIATENHSMLQMSEVMESLREQLATYQLLNADLSKKVQEYKVLFNASSKENGLIGAELMNEKMKTSDLRRALMAVNSHFNRFRSEYDSAINRCQSATELELTMPERDQENLPPRIIQSSAIVFKPASKIQACFDADLSNVLHTICEESEQSRFSTNIDPRASTSTPLQPTVFSSLRNIQNLPSPLHETRVEKEEAENSRHDGHNASKKFSEEHLAPVLRLTQRNSQQNTSDEDSIENETAHSVTEENFNDEAVKDLRVNLTMFSPRNSMVERYQSCYGSSSRASSETSTAENPNRELQALDDDESMVIQSPIRKRVRRKPFPETSSDEKESESDTDFVPETQPPKKIAKQNKRETAREPAPEEKVATDSEETTDDDADRKPSTVKKSKRVAPKKKSRNLRPGRRSSQALSPVEKVTQLTKRTLSKESVEVSSPPKKLSRARNQNEDSEDSVSAIEQTRSTRADSETSNCTVATEASTFTSEVSKGTTRKRKPKAEVEPRRSRPARRARHVIGSLIERPLGTKMRRSK